MERDEVEARGEEMRVKEELAEEEERAMGRRYMK